MSDFITKVWIDSREQKMVKKTTAFFKSKNIESEVKSLGDRGDLAVFMKSSQILNIERKTMQDFVSSYISGHLFDQAKRMNDSCYNYCCIVYGSIDDIRRLSYKLPAMKKITQKSIDKMAAKLQILYGLPVFFVNNEQQYFLKIMELAEMIHKSSGQKVQIKSKITVKSRPDIDILMIASKVGEKTAKLLLEEFGSPKNVLYASREDLLKIKGIGDATVSDIKQLKIIFEEGYNG